MVGAGAVPRGAARCPLDFTCTAPRYYTMLYNTLPYVTLLYHIIHPHPPFLQKAIVNCKDSPHSLLREPKSRTHELTTERTNAEEEVSLSKRLMRLFFFIVIRLPYCASIYNSTRMYNQEQGREGRGYDGKVVLGG